MSEYRTRLSTIRWAEFVDRAAAVGVPLGEVIHVPPPESDEMRHHYFGSYPDTFSRGVVVTEQHARDGDELLMLVRLALNPLGSNAAIMCFTGDDLEGAFETSVEFLVRSDYALSLVELEGDTFAVGVDPDSGLLIDRTPDRPEGLYSISTWGPAFTSDTAAP